MTREQDTGGWCAPTHEEVFGSLDFGTQAIRDAAAIRAFTNLGVIHDALDLVAELWPKPGYQTVTMSRQQWDKLRHVLLSVPEILAVDE